MVAADSASDDGLLLPGDDFLGYDQGGGHRSD